MSHVSSATEVCGALVPGRTALSEAQAAMYCAEILLALEVLHKNDVFVKDLNSEEILLDDLGHVKVYSSVL